MLTLSYQPGLTQLLTAVGYSDFNIAVTVTEDNSNLLYKTVSLQVNWGDGTISDFGPVVSPLSLALTHRYLTGQYNITLKATNSRADGPDVRFDSVTVNVNESQLPETASILGATFGPILPSDTRYPNEDQWSFSIGSNDQIIESAIKMLLITQKGERWGEPEYGTNTARLIFETDPTSVEALLREDLSQAFATWLPSVTLQGILVEKVGRAMRVTITAVHSSRQTYQVTADFQSS